MAKNAAENMAANQARLVFILDDASTAMCPGEDHAGTGSIFFFSISEMKELGVLEVMRK